MELVELEVYDYSRDPKRDRTFSVKVPPSIAPALKKLDRENRFAIVEYLWSNMEGNANTPVMAGAEISLEKS